jgi:hypothetical protein
MKVSRPWNWLTGLRMRLIDYTHEHFPDPAEASEMAAVPIGSKSRHNLWHENNAKLHLDLIFTFTVPPAMLMGVIPKVRCLSLAEPR